MTEGERARVRGEVAACFGEYLLRERRLFPRPEDADRYWRAVASDKARTERRLRRGRPAA